MFQSIEKLMPQGATEGSWLHAKGARPLLALAAVAIVFALFLFADGILSWKRTRLLGPKDRKRERGRFFRRFLAWLFYPSFQAKLKGDDN